MNQKLKSIRFACIASFAAAAAFSSFAAAQAPAASNKTVGADRAAPYTSSDRAYMKAYSNDRDALQTQLKPGMNAAFYRTKLGELGYQVTTVNDRESDYVEYEVVKGANTHEVQIEFDKKSKKATSVDVEMNLWRADSTKAAMLGQSPTVMMTGDYSDRAYRKEWTNEKEGLEKALGTGHDKGYYATKLKQLGYTVTATNDREADYLEYEVVKGNRTYEVQVDFDGASRMSNKVDVEANMWNADATDKALSANKK